MRIYSLDLFYVAIIGRFYNAIDREGESMLDLEEYGTLRELHKQGLSISEIARSTGHSRGTVRKYLRADVPPEVKRRAPKPSKLDGYKDYIAQRLTNYPLTATRIYHEIQEMGFTGKYTIVRDYVRDNRPK
jgi:transposase